MLFSHCRNDSYELFSCAVVLAAGAQRVVSGLTIRQIIYVYRSMTWIGEATGVYRLLMKLAGELNGRRLCRMAGH